MKKKKLSPFVFMCWFSSFFYKSYRYNVGVYDVEWNDHAMMGGDWGAQNILKIVSRITFINLFLSLCIFIFLFCINIFLYSFYFIYILVLLQKSRQIIFSAHEIMKMWKKRKFSICFYNFLFISFFLFFLFFRNTVSSSTVYL